MRGKRRSNLSIRKGGKRLRIKAQAQARAQSVLPVSESSVIDPLEGCSTWYLSANVEEMRIIEDNPQEGSSIIVDAQMDRPVISGRKGKGKGKGKSSVIDVARQESIRMAQQKRRANLTQDELEIERVETLERNRISIDFLTKEEMRQRMELRLDSQRLRRKDLSNRVPRRRDVTEFDESEHALKGSFFGNLKINLEGNRIVCPHCSALLFLGESSSLCCHNGTTKLDSVATPQALMDLHSQPSFANRLRIWNNILSMASIGVKEVGPPRDGNTFRGNVQIQGKLYHKIGNLIAPQGMQPSYFQVYFLETDQANEARNRILTDRGVMDQHILDVLTKMMEEFNPYVKDVKTAIEFIHEKAARNDKVPEGNIIISSNRRLLPPNAHERTYNIPHAPEVAGIILGTDNIIKSRSGGIQLADVVLHYREQPQRRLENVSTLHRAYDPLMYVLLFPCGEDGWTTGMLRDAHGHRRRPTLSEVDFYSYRCQVRLNEFNIITRSRRLFQMYLVDMWAKAEAHKLKWAYNHQKTFRAERYNVMLDVVDSSDFDPQGQHGNRIILPPTIYGSKRFWKKCYQDGMAIVREFGKPDLFLTFTCSTRWPEIVESLRQGESAADRPDLCARVFYLKHEELRNDVLKRNTLGKVIAHVESTEWQKRGLPHVHMLLWLERRDKPNTLEVIDSLVCAEIPDPTVNKELYELVKTHMIHGPCGIWNRHSPCMVIPSTGGVPKCSKAFPKSFQTTTVVRDDFYPTYRRRSVEDGGRYFNIQNRSRDSLTVDNSYVVPYNPALLLKFKSHINLEVVNNVFAVKYIFKYINKGQDRLNIAVSVERENQGGRTEDQHQPGGFVDTMEADPTPNWVVGGGELQTNENQVDEIKEYHDGRYLSSGEAIWKIFGFKIHWNHPNVVLLPLHLPNEESVLISENMPIDPESIRSGPPVDKLSAFFKLNQECVEARNYVYPDIVKAFSWISKRGNQEAHWKKRERGRMNQDTGIVETDAVGRIPMVPMGRSELYHLRLLLVTVKGPTSFQDLRTTNDGQVLPTFQQACVARDLIENDDVVRQTLDEVKEIAFGRHLRQLFCTILVYHTPANASALWEDSDLQRAFVEDYRRASRSTHINDTHRNRALADIQDILEGMGKRMEDFGLPLPDASLLDNINPIALQMEMDYDADALRIEVNNGIPLLNTEQKMVFDQVLESVNADCGRVFCLNAAGGTGKTFTLKLILKAVRASNKVALATATSGIAAQLLDGGRTIHSRFKVPINLTDESTCRFDRGTKALIKKTALIVIDEVTMGNRKVYECLDRSLRDLMVDVNPERSRRNFGGITVLMAGDWRQILPVIPKGKQGDIIRASVLKSYIWEETIVLTLVRNMRAELSGGEVAQFAKLLDDVGSGKYPHTLSRDISNHIIKIPDEMRFPPQNVMPGPNESKEILQIRALVKHIFYLDHYVRQVDNQIEDTTLPLEETLQFSICNNAIICPTNAMVKKVNDEAINVFPGNQRTYFSCDRLLEDNRGEDYSLEFIKTLDGGSSSFPDHCLTLKVGCIIMLLRNLDPARGHCNGTRYIVRHLNNKTIDAVVATGVYKGQRHIIPRLKFLTGEDYPFQFSRTQFPVRLAFGITANKSQGQTYKKVGICLHQPFFTHGQLYVALSRVGRKEDVTISVGESGQGDGRTVNVVYRQVLEAAGLS